MAAHQTFNSSKKTFFYNFLSTKEEEDLMTSQRSGGDAAKVDRILIEIRDIYPPPVVGLSNPWVMRKTLSQYEAACGKLHLSYGDTFEHVIRYWTMGMANYVVVGQRVGVTVWDCTEDRNPRKYHGNDVYLQMMDNDDFLVSCMEFVRDRRLKFGDVIGLYWDPMENCFKMKLVS